MTNPQPTEREIKALQIAEYQVNVAKVLLTVMGGRDTYRDKDLK